jgi:hypothetical protein
VQEQVEQEQQVQLMEHQLQEQVGVEHLEVGVDNLSYQDQVEQVEVVLELQIIQVLKEQLEQLIQVGVEVVKITLEHHLEQVVVE